MFANLFNEEIGMIWRLYFISLLIIFCMPAQAQDNIPSIESFEKIAGSITKRAAQDAIKLALSRVARVPCDAGKPCTPPTSEEYNAPPISEDDARAAMTFAVFGALADWCGLDAKRAFIPMIRTAKEKGGMNTRQLQLMSLVHGDFFARQVAFYKSKGTCPVEFKTRLDAKLVKPKM